MQMVNKIKPPISEINEFNGLFRVNETDNGLQVGN